MTEAAPGVSAAVGGELLGHGHVGRPLPGVEVRIGDGTEPTEPGEIWIRGDNLFAGYWPDGRGGPGELGWFPTGDVGYLLDGELFLVDRARELIIVNGFNVYPAEVEEAIGELPGVESVAVVGRPYRRTGEQVVAFVTGAGLVSRRSTSTAPIGSRSSSAESGSAGRGPSQGNNREGKEGRLAAQPGGRW